MDNSDFPVEEAKGCRYSGWESGIHFEGEVADVVVEDEFVKIINTEGRVALMYRIGWGDWWWQGEKIMVSVPMVGSYELFHPRVS